MKRTILLATCAIALVAGAANARTIGTGQEAWRTNNPWTHAADPRWSDNTRNGANWGDRGYDARGDERDMDSRADRKAKANCKMKKNKNKKACKKMMRDEMRRDRMDRDMDRRDMRRDYRDDRRDGRTTREQMRDWKHDHSRIGSDGERHMDLDRDGRRW